MQIGGLGRKRSLIDRLHHPHVNSLECHTYLLNASSQASSYPLERYRGAFSSFTWGHTRDTKELHSINWRRQQYTWIRSSNCRHFQRQTINKEIGTWEQMRATSDRNDREEGNSLKRGGLPVPDLISSPALTALTFSAFTAAASKEDLRHDLHSTSTVAPAAGEFPPNPNQIRIANEGKLRTIQKLVGAVLTSGCDVRVLTGPLLGWITGPINS